MINKEQRAQTILDWAGAANQNGSTQAQIGLLTERIKDISAHVKINKKDYSSTRGLLMLVGARRRLLRYLTRTNPVEAEKISLKIKGK